jgi:hypothetical protein
MTEGAGISRALFVREGDFAPGFGGSVVRQVNSSDIE